MSQQLTKGMGESYLPAEEAKKINVPDLRQDTEPLKFLIQLCDDIDKEINESSRQRAEKWTRNFMYWLGGTQNFWGFYDEGQWHEQQNTDGLRSCNFFAKGINTLLSVLTKATVKFSVQASPAHQDDDQATGGAKVGLRILQHEQKNDLTPIFMGLEWMRNLLCGSFYRIIAFDKELGRKVKVPQMEEQEFGESGAYFCTNLECGMTGPDNMAQGGQCPHCQSPVAVIGGAQRVEPIHTGYEEKMSGDTITYSVDPFEVGLASDAHGIEDSPFVRWEQRMRKKFVAHKYGLSSTKGLTTSSTLSPMMEAQYALQNVLSSGDMTKPALNQNSCIIQRYYIEPFMYFDWTLKTEIKCASGSVIPPGKVIEFAPQGLYVCRNAELFLDIYPSAKNDEWSGGQYYQNPNSPYGKGQDDGADYQDVVGDLWTIIVNHGKRDAVGTTYIDQSLGLDQSKTTGGYTVPVNLQGDHTQPMDHRILNVSGNQMSPTLPATLEAIERLMSEVMGAYEVLAGSNENAPDTATATSLLTERALTGLNPMLARWAGAMVTWGEQILKLKQKYMGEAEYVPYVENGEKEQGRWFRGADIPNEFVVTVEEDSWVPRTRLDALADIERASSFGGLPGGIFNPEVDPNIKGHFLKLTNMPDNVDDTLKDKQVCQKNMKLIKQRIESAPQGMNPEEVIMSVLMSPDVEFMPDIYNAGVHIKTVQNEILDLMDDEMDEPNPLYVQALRMYIKSCKEGGIQAEAEKTAAAIQAQAPAMEAQAAMEAQNQPPPEANEPNAEGDASRMHDAEQQKTQNDQELLTKGIDLAEADKQREHEATESEKQRAFELKREKMKPKPTAKGNK